MSSRAGHGEDTAPGQVLLQTADATARESPRAAHSKVTEDSRRPAKLLLRRCCHTSEDPRQAVGSSPSSDG